MAGHSKFANIKHKKEKNDAQRGKIFTRLGREIVVAVKSGGPDPASNARLREVITKARSNNMSGDTIERSIKKASGELSGTDYESVVYEGYGPSGVAVIVEVLTDNRNRAAANVRNAFTKGGGNMGTTGCVSFMFEKKGLILVEKDDNIDEDGLMMLALEHGAGDFEASDEGFEIQSAPEDFYSLHEALEKANTPMISAEITMIAGTYTALKNDDDVKKMKKMLALLDEEDDVQNVYHNWENEE